MQLPRHKGGCMALLSAHFSQALTFNHIQSKWSSKVDVGCQGWEVKARNSMTADINQTMSSDSPPISVLILLLTFCAIRFVQLFLLNTNLTGNMLRFCTYRNCVGRQQKSRGLGPHSTCLCPCQAHTSPTVHEVMLVKILYGSSSTSITGGCPM
jgi:hypothetical protein